jgi:hypothetical protein
MRHCFADGAVLAVTAAFSAHAQALAAWPAGRELTWAPSVPATPLERFPPGVAD